MRAVQWRRARDCAVRSVSEGREVGTSGGESVVETMQ